MLDNRVALARLLDDNSLAMRQGMTLRQFVPTLPTELGSGRCEGMLLGVAIGDALGRPSESMIPSHRRRSHGEVRNDHRHRRAGGGRCEGHPSDDTLLTFWILDQLLVDGGLDPTRLSDRLASSGKIIGEETIRTFRGNLGLPWWKRAVIRAVNDTKDNDTKDNDTKDNDTVAAIVGAAVGALHGRSAWPKRRVSGLTGGLTRKDRGTVFNLIDRAERDFGRTS